VLIEAEVIYRVATGALRRVGVAEEHAELQVALLLEAELRGRPSHGLLRLPRIVARIINKVANPVAVGLHQWKGDAYLDVDGEAGLGPVVACAAIDAIEAKAKVSGVSIAAIRNNNHLGMLGWYAERVASCGSILIALSTSEALVHPWGGRRPRLGTNPIAIGVPATPRPFVMDMATSLVSMGQIHDHVQRGEPIPGHWALDAAGEPTTSPRAAAAGSIAPFGEAKGYALGLAFEVLVASLTASAIGQDVRGTLDETEACNKGDVFIVVNSAASASMTAAIGAYLREVRSGPPAEGFKSVAIPGDRSEATREQRLRSGVPVDEALWSHLLDLAGAASKTTT
jgi:L-2-hydroxycarboxylate dehydrogenase (NAD+)